MKIRRFGLLVLVVTIVFGSLSFAAPSSVLAAEAGVAYIRAVHASPDAPRVDIYVNNAKAVSSLRFGTSTGWVPLAAGVTYKIALRAAGADAASDPVLEKSFTLTKDSSTLLVAEGFLNGVAPQPSLDLKGYAINRLDPKAGARLDFVQASPDSPAIDVLIGGRAVIRSLGYGRKNLVPLDVDAAPVDIQVTPAGKRDQPVIDLTGFRPRAGKIYTILAIWNVDAVKPLVLESDPYTAFVRLVHAVPDAPGVDVYIDGVYAYGTLYFGGYSRFLQITAGPHDVALRAGSASASSDPVYEVKGVNFDINSSTTAIVEGLLKGEGDQALTIATYNTDRSPVSSQARVYIIHAVPDAPTVDVYLGGTRPLVRNLRFSKGTTVPTLSDPGSVDVKVTPNGQADTIVISATGVRLQQDTIYTIIAVGTLAKAKALVLSAPVYDPLTS